MSSEVSEKRKSRFPKPGRPKAIIDWNKVDQWLIAGANGAQIAASLGIHPDTLYKACENDHKTNFTAYLQEKRAIGDRLIHNTQFEVACKNKNTTMLVWLGKQRLGQKDKDEEVTVTPETMVAFQSFMDMINKAQSSALNKEETSNNTESKS